MSDLSDDYDSKFCSQTCIVLRRVEYAAYLRGRRDGRAGALRSLARVIAETPDPAPDGPRLTALPPRSGPPAPRATEP